MQISTELQQQMEPMYLQMKEAIENGATVNTGLWTFLQDSEQQLINLMNDNPPPENAPGNIEASWALYFLNNDAPSWLTGMLKDIGMPSSKITAANWSSWDTTLKGQGVLMGDGSLVSFATYAIVDPGWSLALIYYMCLELGIIQKSSFGNNPKTLVISNKNQLNVALFGDWGTGSYPDGNLPASPSQLIGQQLNKMNPDLSIHLGDVYYAGSGFEEKTRLLDCWPVASLGNFTLNSNHEMYYGANGLFGIALASPLFAAQQNTTYFQVQFGNWLIIGLDSAYYDTSSMFMTGVITDSDQLVFLKQAGMQGKKICILTHHNPLDTIGQNKLPLWNQVVNALGKEPDYWYWGHVHNGMVYSAQSAGANVKCRCLGNAAIPIGNSEWLQSNPSSVSFYTNKPLANTTIQQRLRVLNGFAMLQFTADDVKENWYYQDGSPAWTS